MKSSVRYRFINLKRNYILLFESGLIVSLLTVIGFFKLDLPNTKSDSVWTIPDREILQLESIPQTTHKPKSPLQIFIPPKIPVNKIIRDRIVNLDMELTIPKPLPEPPPITSHHTGLYKTLNNNISKPMTYVDEMPKLIGGKKGLRERINYPKKAIRDNVQGRVIVQFVVDEYGKVQNPEILKGVREDINNEAIRAITKARFKPGRQQGKVVRVKYVMFIRFLLEYDPD
ncbi:MAG TPA: energy transducer TonB [Balneolaceae bacterium]|nr:energy transducer TonB [Balneolaceae bacterium]